MTVSHVSCQITSLIASQQSAEDEINIVQYDCNVKILYKVEKLEKRENAENEKDAFSEVSGSYQ